MNAIELVKLLEQHLNIPKINMLPLFSRTMIQTMLLVILSQNAEKKAITQYLHQKN